LNTGDRTKDIFFFLISTVTLLGLIIDIQPFHPEEINMFIALEIIKNWR
jgi:hypothetical protein